MKKENHLQVTTRATIRASTQTLSPLSSYCFVSHSTFTSQSHSFALNRIQRLSVNLRHSLVRLVLKTRRNHRYDCDSHNLLVLQNNLVLNCETMWECEPWKPLEATVSGRQCRQTFNNDIESRVESSAMSANSNSLRLAFGWMRPMLLLPPELAAMKAMQVILSQYSATDNRIYFFAL